MKNLSEEIIQFFKENEYLDKVEKQTIKNPNGFKNSNISDELQEFFHKLIEFKNRF